MGCLNATDTPDYCAGIGSNQREKNSHIIICGGRIEAFGGRRSAGIGSAECGNSTVDIYNGIIEARGGSGGSGIGSGSGAANGADTEVLVSSSFVNIYNGNIKSWGGDNAAGIGGGLQGKYKVNIYNGVVEAWGGDNASGIGAGNGSPTGAVYISKSVKATGHKGNKWCSDIDSLQDTPVTASTISEGNIWIIAGIGAVAVVTIVVIAAKKKKKTA